VARAKKQEAEDRRSERAAEEALVAERHSKLDKQETTRASQRLEYLLKQSDIFAKFQGGGKLPGQEEDKKPKSSKKKKNHRDEEVIPEDEDPEAEEEAHVFLSKQPNCIKFGTLKQYQLEGLNWMIHLAEKGLNGILADEMGLGKTLQSISIMAYQYEYMKIAGPHLVCVPKSTLSNWMNELARWCPALRVIRFHGTKDEREAMKEEFFDNEAAAHDGRRPERRIKNAGEWQDDNSSTPRAWDVCVTTYEVCNTERKVLQKFAWKYLVIDEAHRLKNETSMFSKTVRTFHTQHRLLLTGTPLQNNLHELWALLNFLLPDIFSSADQFDEWFNLEIDDEDTKKQMIATLHKILRPFMIRRLKVDVAKGLPPKTETLIMVGMSKMQKQLYKKLLLRDLDSIVGKAGSSNRTAVLNIVMQLRKCCGHPYLFEGMEDRTLDPLGDHLVDNCGKLYMVDKLLTKLKERGSRVLIFTQMTRVLDILEDFMVMRGHKYCRIDGNTTYDDREANIDNFNAPNSELFCFILSTRAGGLGINLQTADTCILYDSDWNPQQDLQAQDRCHRLGQKKPVNVYRLVSENTVEEKIVERAQQKLKLDAMVVQQGRLSDKAKISKDDMMAAIRFGADNVFRSDESTITDDDIDLILQRGAAKTKELAEKIQKAEKGNLLDFSLDAGMSAQTFEGVDYSDKEMRSQLRLLAHDSLGKRERRPPPTDYNPIMAPKKSMVVNNQRIKLPRCLRLPQMEDHHFFNRERLLELGHLEFENYAMLREVGQLPPREFIEKERTLLDDDLGQEKMELLDEGFGEWTRSQYFHFVKTSAKFGRDDIANIAADMDMSEEAVAAYSAALWKYGPDELKKEEWERIVSSIERGEKKIVKQRKLTSLLHKFVSTFENPREEIVFANKGTTHFSLEQDRALLCAVNKHGYGNWDSVREDLRMDKNLLFQHMVQGMNTDMIAKRVDYRMRQMEKECEAREKTLKNLKPANVIAAEKAIAAIREMEDWETEARGEQLRGLDRPPVSGLSDESRQNITERVTERQGMIDRLREIEIQVRSCKDLAEETREAIVRGDQYVNYSHITLKAGGPNSKEGGHLSITKGANGEDVEARISRRILSTPECGVCPSCTDRRVRTLCAERLKVRDELLDNETKKMDAELKKGKGSKKRSLQTASPKPGGGKLSPKPGAGGTAANGGTGGAGASTTKKSPSAIKKKPRVTSQGNKRMSIPAELFPQFCRRIGAVGTAQRMKLINKFVEDFPDISVRQVTMKFTDITTKDCPPGITPPEKKSGRAFQFYLRPKFYKHLGPEDTKPENWEHLMREDAVLFSKEQEQKKTEQKTKDQQMKDLISETASTKSQTSDGGEAGGGASVAEDDGDETEDETTGEPPLKKSKVATGEE